MLCFLDLQGKLQKHQAFDAEVVANKDRIFSTISMGQGIVYCNSLVLILNITNLKLYGID